MSINLTRISLVRISRAAWLAAPLTLVLASVAQASDKQAIAVGDMQRFCQGEASAKFGERPQSIATLPVERHDNGAHSVFGQYPPEGSKVTTFECRFTPKNHFSWVKKTGHTGNGKQSSHSEPETTTVPVQFDPGTNGAEIAEALTPGSSARYVLRAKEGQDLYVRVAHISGPQLDYQIFNPDKSFLLGMTPSDREYRGQLLQSGDQVVEVINRGHETADYQVIFGID